MKPKDFFFYRSFSDRHEPLIDILEAVERDDPSALLSLIASEIAQFGSLPLGSIDPLVNAAGHGRLACLKLLIPHCDPAGRHCANGDTALQAAAENGQLACLHELLPLCDPDPDHPIRPQPLHFAAGNGHLDCVLALIPLCDPNRLCPWSQNSPAAKALLAGHLDCFKALAPLTDLSNEAPCEIWERDFLMLCADDKLAHCLEAALPYSDLNKRDKRGFSALTWAAMNNSLCAVNILLPFFDPRELTPRGYSAAVIADRHSDGQVAQALRAHAALLDEQDALELASAGSHDSFHKPRL